MVSLRSTRNGIPCFFYADLLTHLKAIGLEPLFGEAIYKKSPYTHLERFSDTKKEANTKANFFEASVTSYVMSSSIEGWDDF